MLDLPSVSAPCHGIALARGYDLGSIAIQQ